MKKSSNDYGRDLQRSWDEPPHAAGTQNALIQNMVQSGIYTDSIGSLVANAYQQAVQKEPLLRGVPLWRGKPVPEDWRGAEITDVVMHHIDDNWRITLLSKWMTEEIKVYLASEEYSGKQAREFGETIRDALNARRLG